MSQEPIDFEAERRRAAKELGLPYNDLDDPVHWQRNMQTQEAKKELAEMLSVSDTKRQSREPLEDESTLELGRGRGISNLDKKARITRPAPLI